MITFVDISMRVDSVSPEHEYFLSVLNIEISWYAQAQIIAQLQSQKKRFGIA